MDGCNANTDAKFVKKYENLLQMRKVKLEKMRKERQILQFEKLKREANTSPPENIEEMHFKNEVQRKASGINDAEIDKIQQELKKFEKDSNSSQINTTRRKISPTSKVLNLKFSNIQITEIPPIETATHSKQTQTEKSRLYIKNIETINYVYDDKEYPDNDETPLKLYCNFSSNLPPGILSPGLPNVMDIPPAFTPIDKDNPWFHLKEKHKKIMDHTSTNNEMIYSESFKTSLNRASMAMERVLNNNKNIYVDYIGDAYGYNDINDNNSNGLIKLKHVFSGTGLTNKRCITSIDWSLHYPDQIVTSYFKTEQSTFDTDGDVKIWNENLKGQIPQYAFNCHSSVMSLSFTKFNPHLILGATYSGQIAVWDSRVKTSIPVQCTKLNSKAHTQPIYCLREIDYESSHYMLSISTDGKLCLWNLDMLSQPIDITQLQINVSNKIKNPISVTCMDLFANGTNSLVLGAEDGYVYSAFRNGYESGISNRYDRHEAPITSISSHYEFGNLFLTSSIDCMIKLWSIERSNPLHTFKNNYDYFMDLAWSPIHPATFIAVDGSGCLDLYNLNENFDEPIESVTIKEGAAINRVAWSKSGQHVAFGTEYGELYLYKIADELANPASEESNIFKETLHGLGENYEIESYG